MKYFTIKKGTKKVGAVVSDNSKNAIKVYVRNKKKLNIADLEAVEQNNNI